MARSDTIRRVLKYPADTRIEWKSHDESMQQRTMIEESRREKAHNHHNDKRTHNKSRQAQEDQQS
ncbi:hypothetical protein RRF57_006569 [Xylaria bambusicola]|uniref:Uncharacterized protein n=1 Tax=Xylaria bambusicola TaxID=326684 RepID=A0AAN7USQ3_9PEZI